jgi:hypothetical protein
MLAFVVTEQVIKPADCVIDFHCGDSTVNINNTNVAEVPGELGRKILEFSKAFGHEMLYRGPFFHGSATMTAIEAGKIGLIVELGTDWWQFERYMDLGVRGITNIMKKLKMIDGPIQLPKKQFMISGERATVLSRHGGIFNPSKEFDHKNLIGKVVDGGTVLARIISPYTFEVLEEIKAPYKRSVIIFNRIGQSRVNPGNYLYDIGDWNTAEWITNE